MSANRKLTGVLQGRTIAQVERQGTTSIVHFDDGSTMTVQTAPEGAASAGSASPPVLGRVRGVRQQGLTLQLDLDNGSTLSLRTAEPTASVLVRAKDHTLEYAD